MEEIETQSCDGLLIILLRVRNPERKEVVIDRLIDIGAEHVSANAFEMSIADWDDGLWDEELEWFSDLVDGTRDSLIVWRFSKSEFVRFTVGHGS